MAHRTRDRSVYAKGGTATRKTKVSRPKGMPASHGSKPRTKPKDRRR